MGSAADGYIQSVFPRAAMVVSTGASIPGRLLQAMGPGRGVPLPAFEIGAKNGSVLFCSNPMDTLLFASAVAPKGLPVILPALAGAGILIFLSQLFVPKT
jgi:hypothetical protein